VLGRSGDLTWTDVIEQVVSLPQDAKFMCAKLWTYFVSENPEPALIDALAAEFRKGNNHFKPVLRLIMRSAEFYSASVIGQQVKSPVQWLVSSVRMLERDLPPPLSANAALRQLGQDLFAPPNVKGWDGGLSWITTNNLINRYNFAAVLVMGRQALPMVADKERARRFQERLARLRKQANSPINVEKILSAEDRQSKERLIAALEKRLLQGKLRSKQADALREYLNAQKELTDLVVLNAIRLVMSTPDFQLT
jgi:uncharacterized protein (DUF1800 family)